MYNIPNAIELSRPVGKGWTAVAYIRLSKEDVDRKQESESITSQRFIIKEYVDKQSDFAYLQEYKDDGYTGTNTRRPEFQRMLADANAKKFDCIIVKDFSRFARNLTDFYDTIDKKLTPLGVRVISIGDGIDTLHPDEMKMGFVGIVNENYAATTSRNIRAALYSRRENGMFIGAFACYGYKKDPENKSHLIIDDIAAETVREVFSLFISGESIRRITISLNDRGIPNPSDYKRLRGFNYTNHFGKGDGLWSDRTVRRMLSNEMYIGNLVQGKNMTRNFKDRTSVAIHKDNWTIVENTHEAIIERETFAKVQALLARKGVRVSPKQKAADLFAGMVRCFDCGRAMNKKTNKHSYGTYHYYRCATARKMSKKACSNHTIRIDVLENAVLVSLQQMIRVAIDSAEFIRELSNNPKRKSASASMQKALDEQNVLLQKNQRILDKLFPSYAEELISKEEFIRDKQKYEAEREEIKERIASLAQEIAKFENGIGEENPFLASFKKYGTIDRLTREIVVELIDYIAVEEGGKIHVHFKFRDEYAKIKEYLEANAHLLTA